MLKWPLHLCNVTSCAHAELVGVLVVQQHVRQQRHDGHGEGERLRGVNDRQLQERDHVRQHAHHRLVRVWVRAALRDGTVCKL